MNGQLFEYKINESTDWRQLLKARPWVINDIYFLPEWYRIWEKSGYGEARCLYCKVDEDEFLYPFLYRQIGGYQLPGVFYDIETAYGYGGVLTTKSPELHSIEKFNCLIDKWMKEKNVVSEFIRLHPLNTSKIRKADYVKVRQDVFLDLIGQTKNTIWDNVINRKTRNTLRVGQKQGLQVFFDDNMTTIVKDFIPLYRETTIRLSMEAFYFFPDDYFRKLQEELQGLAFVINVACGHEIAASSIWLNHGEYVHYFLGATATKFLKYPCSDAYIWAVICRALDSDSKSSIHLGGGLSINEDDSLYRFKSKYSNRNEPVYIGKNVHYPHIYKLLCEQWQKQYPHLVSKHSHKLLMYRQTEG